MWYTAKQNSPKNLESRETFLRQFKIGERIGKRIETKKSIVISATKPISIGNNIKVE